MWSSVEDEGACGALWRAKEADVTCWDPVRIREPTLGKLAPRGQRGGTGRPRGETPGLLLQRSSPWDFIYKIRSSLIQFWRLAVSVLRS